jgi:hypothetical protein
MSSISGTRIGTLHVPFGIKRNRFPIFREEHFVCSLQRPENLLLEGILCGRHSC